MNGLLKIISGLLFVTMMMAVAFFVQFAKYNAGQKVLGEPQLSFTDYARYSYDLMIAQYEQRQAEANFAVANAVPEAPEGWHKTPYNQAHGKQLTGQAYKLGPVAFGHEHVVQMDYLRAAGQTKRKTAVAYVRGSSIVAVLIQVEDEPAGNTIEAGVAKHLEKFVVAEEAATGPKGQIVMNGFTLQRVSNPRGGAKSYRTFQKNIGGQIVISVISNASDAEIAEVMSLTDIEMLNAHAGVRNETAPPAAPQPSGDQIAATDESGQPALSAEETALAAAVTAKLAAGAATDKSFMTRLKTFLLQSGEKEEEIKKPARAKCKKKKGFKHCVFEKEED